MLAEILTGAMLAGMDVVMWMLVLVAFYFCRSAREWALAFVSLLAITTLVRIFILSGWTPPRLLGAGAVLLAVTAIGFALKSRFARQPSRSRFQG